MDLRLSGRKVLVTGASKGIGLAIARWFAREGCSVVMAARSGDLLKREAAMIGAETGVGVQTLAMDLSSAEGRQALKTACPETDVLINNAGDIPAGAIDAVDDAAWRAGWELKVFGYIDLTRHYLAQMKVRANGVIINIIGSAGERPIAGYVAGSMGNSSLMAMTVAIGSTSADYGVRVLGVNPGPIETDRVIKFAKRRARQAFGDESRYRETFKQYPFGRPGSADEVAATVVFLASDLSGYTSGTIVTIDGGYSKRGVF